MIPVPSVTSAQQTPAPSVKFALSVKKNFDPHTVSMTELFDKEIFLATRPFCETDNTSLQLIPYITLVDESGEKPKYFIYTRGKSSGEQRLVGKCSIGLGGHIETIKLLSILNIPLINSIADAAARELEEEVGFLVPFSVFANAIKPGYTNTAAGFKDALVIPKATLLYNELTSADVVHLGVSFVLHAKESDILSTEYDVITRGQWMTYEEIMAPSDAENQIDLEFWSKEVLNNLNSFYSKK